MDVAIIRQTWTAFREDKVPRLASAIAYATIFSLAPLLIVLIAVVGAVLGLTNGGHGHHVAEDALLGYVRQHVGRETAGAVRAPVASAFGRPHDDVIAQVIGWVAFVAAASGLFSTLQDALNSVWHVEAAKGGWKLMLRDRLAAFGMLVVVGFLMLVSFAVNAALAIAQSHFAAQLAHVTNAAVLQLGGQIVMLALMTVVFALMYKVLPDVDLHWRDVRLGAFATAVLFLVGEALIAEYLARAGIASAYGAAGALLVLLLWLYYSAVVFLMGAEFTKVSAGHATTIAPSTISRQVEVESGVDPRTPAQPRV